MKKYIIALALSLVALTSFARTAAEVVDEVVAAMPANDAATFAANMDKLAAVAPECVEILGSMLKPAAEGVANAKIEYAISGLARYATANPAIREAVEEGLRKAAEAQEDPNNKAFIESELRFFGVAPEPAPGFSEEPVAAADVLSALMSADRKVRVKALRLAEGGKSLIKKVVKAEKAEGADADVLYWLGERKAKCAMDYIIAAFDGPDAADARAAAAKIGGRKAADALCALLEDGDVPELAFFNGNFSKSLAKVLKNGSDEAKVRAVNAASARHMTKFASYAFETPETYPALKNLITKKDAAKLASLLDSCEEGAASVSEAYIKALGLGGKSEETVIADIEKASNPERFYKALAASDSDYAAEYLSAKYAEGSEEALAALMTMSNRNIEEALHNAVKADDAYMEKYLCTVVSAGYTPDVICAKFTEAGEIAKTNAGVRTALNFMATLKTSEMLAVTDSYAMACWKTPEKYDIACTAALASTSIMKGCGAEMGYDAVLPYARRAIDVFQSPAGNVEIYVVNEIEQFLDSIR